MSSYDNSQAALIAEQLSHTIDLLKAETRMLAHRVTQLEDSVKDHETRIRTATDGITQYKVWAGLASGGSGIFSIIALIKAFFGG